MNWRKYSLYHVLSKRRNSMFMKQTAVDFLSGITRTDSLPASVAISILIFNGFLFLSYNMTLLQYMLIGITLYGLASAVMSAVDTYYMRKMRIRRSAIKSIKVMLGGKRDRW